MARGGRPDSYLIGIRASIEDKRKPSFTAHISKPNEKGETSNHVWARMVEAFAVNPEQGRAYLLEWIDRQLHTTGLNCRGVGGASNEQPVMTSHGEHEQAAIGAGILLAMRYGDEQVLTALCEITGRCLALFDYLATPEPDVRIIGAGPRSTFHPDHRDTSDQRKQIASWYSLWRGIKWRRPATLATGDDELGLYALTLAQKESGWDSVLNEVNKYRGESALPLVHARYLIKRGDHGIASYFPYATEDWPNLSGVATWATCDLRIKPLRRNVGDSDDERYGFDTETVPDCPGGETAIIKLPWAGSSDRSW